MVFTSFNPKVCKTQLSTAGLACSSQAVNSLKRFLLALEAWGISWGAKQWYSFNLLLVLLRIAQVFWPWQESSFYQGKKNIIKKCEREDENLNFQLFGSNVFLISAFRGARLLLLSLQKILLPPCGSHMDKTILCLTVFATAKSLRKRNLAMSTRPVLWSHSRSVQPEMRAPAWLYGTPLCCCCQQHLAGEQGMRGKCDNLTQREDMKVSHSGAGVILAKEHSEQQTE